MRCPARARGGEPAVPSEGPEYAAVPDSSESSVQPALRCLRLRQVALPLVAACAAVALLVLALPVAAGWRQDVLLHALRSSLRGGLQGKDEFYYAKFAPAFDEKRESCGPTQSNVDFGAREGGSTEVAMLLNVGSADMCCAACAGYPECNMWTWGSAPHVDWLTQVCWLKQLQKGETLVKTPKRGVISGLPNPKVEKYGVIPAPASSSDLMDGVEPKTVDAHLAQGAIAAKASDADDAPPTSRKCPGVVFVEGHGLITLVNAGGDTPGNDAGIVEAREGDLVLTHMTGRTYFGKTCTEGAYQQSDYEAINLLGKTMSWTTDISGTGCGCNAALYLVSMAQSSAQGDCNGDYYCDAMKVCGVPCAEIDLQEANMYSWMSTLHTYNELAGPDSLGVARGYGGSIGEPERRDWTHEEYGPGASCIDTTKPFQVAVSFPVDDNGVLEKMELRLSQDGCALQACTHLAEYKADGHRPQEELTAALQAGMTPVISYWKSQDMLWMDGIGVDGRGPCVKDAPDTCPEHVRFYGFTIEDIA